MTLKMGRERNPLLLISKLFSRNSQSKNFVLNSLIFDIGLFIGVVLTLCFKSFSFTLLPAGFALSSQLATLQKAASQPSQPPDQYSCHPPPPPSPSLPPPPLPVLDPQPPPPPPSKSSILVLSFDQYASNGTSNHTCDNSLKEQTSLMHNMNDKELFWRASMVPQVENFPYKFVPKVAFMFLTQGPMPLVPLWEMVFKGHQGLYTIYVHPRPSYKHSWPENSIFYQRRIPSKHFFGRQFVMLQSIALLGTWLRRRKMEVEIFLCCERLKTILKTNASRQWDSFSSSLKAVTRLNSALFFAAECTHNKKKKKKGWIVSTLLAGATVGSFTGTLADKFGRTKTFMLDAIPLVVGAFLWFVPSTVVIRLHHLKLLIEKKF